MLSIGDKVPLDLKVIDENNNEISLRSFLGTTVVLYFYPKDDTPGCTVEACSLRDANEKIKSLGAKVIGVSKDDISSHKKFKEKHNLNFDLWSDESHKLMKGFGTWQLKKFMGREYMGTTRSTFLIDSKGKIVNVWENVKSEGHAEEVLGFLNNYINNSNNA